MPIDVPPDSHWVRVGFLHLLGANQGLAVKDHTLKFYFRNCPPNQKVTAADRNFRDAFIEDFVSREEEIRSALPERADLTGNKHNRIEATYSIPVDDHEQFFDAYVDALETAFKQHTVENPELIQILDSTYHDTLDKFR